MGLYDKIRNMGRGRPRAVSDDRVLIELLLYHDRAVFTSEVADVCNVTPQTIRERMSDLADDGYVDITELDSGNLYRLTENGYDYLRELLREDYD
jgi:predicted transcriptional regulator